MSAVGSTHVLVERQGTLGRIRLNRPQALNCLNLDMVRAVIAALDDFARDDRIAAVLVDGLGERGLCAGGDIRAVWQSARAADGEAEAFFRDEYVMNAAIAAYPKPYVAFMDGITMGGGVGISAHGSHRVVTERTRLAMPETAIGFFPDVGGTWLLANLPGEVGTYLGLTGNSIAGADAIDAGLADVRVQSFELPNIAAALSGLQPLASKAEVSALLETFAEEAQAPLAASRAVIAKTFGFETVREIFAALEAEGSEPARAMLAVLLQRSPTSLIVTLRLLRLARASSSLQQCLDREYSVATRMMNAPDFAEGVRAAVIDKDRNPRWRPATLDEVDEAALRIDYV